MVEIPLRYKISGDSDKGGFGEVVFCEDVHLKRRVAIKFIQDPSQKRRMVDEINALLQMRSKHVVQVYDIINCSDGSIGIVEEFVDGEDLFESDYPKKSLDNYLKTLWQIASGIADIHNAGLIHRDIKPNNMKFDPEGIVRIFDFGLARSEGEDALTKGFRGSRLFAAPELFSLDTVTFTRHIDTYAFGATALILAVEDIPPVLGTMPPGRAPERLFADLPIDIPATVADLLQKCFAVDPEERPSMQSIQDEIARYLLHGKHQALAIYKGEPRYLNSEKKQVRLSLPDVGSISILYTGLGFTVTEVSGEVYLNNRLLQKDCELTGSCVVSLGGAHRRASHRSFITFDISYPEVVI